jgi:hypothetical protein
MGEIMNRFSKAFTTAGILVASVLGANTAQASGTPTVVSVTSTSANGTYTVGQTVTLRVTFSEPVNVLGWLAMTLETGPTDRTVFCSNCSGNDTNVTTRDFSYKVQVGDRSSDLDYQSTKPIMFNTGRSVASSTTGKISATDDAALASLVFPTPGQSGSLSANSQLLIDGSGEAEQWQSPAAAVSGLHSFVMQEDMRDNVSQLYSADANWANWRLCAATIMNVTVTGGTGTIKTATALGIQSGEQVTVSGLSNSLLSGTLNATHTVTSVSGLTIAFAFTGTLASTAVTSGTVSRNCSSGNVWYKSVLKSCVNAADVDCIEGVYAQNGISAESLGVIDQLYPLRGSQDFLSPSAGVPTGGPSSIFTFSGTPHAQGNKYAVTVTLTGTKSASGTVNSPSFFASITPVSFVTTLCDTRYNGDGNGYCMDSSSGGVAVDRDGGYRCIMWDNTESNTDTDERITNGDGNGDVSTCAKKHAFPANTKFKVNVRLSQTPKGWFHGRMNSPEISLATTGGVNYLSVKAGSVGVPTVGASGTFEGLSQPVKDWFTQYCNQAQGRQCGTRFDTQNWSDPLYRNAEMTPYPYSATSFSQLEMWKSFFGDSAGAVPTNWNVRTLADSEMGSASSCVTSASGITGVVTTNSTLYSQGPPVYSPSSGTLDYQVAAPHFLNDGVTEFLGDYNLLVREDVAQCLYGFTGTEITSSMSVVDTSGAVKQATTSLTRENGFYKFSASGFTFSAPTIKAKLQGVQAAAAPEVDVPDVAVPAVTIPAVTIPAVTVPAVTVPVVTVPVLTPKIGTPVVVASPPAAQVAAGLGMSAEKTVVRTSIKVPALVKGVGIKSYQVVLRSSTGKIVALQTISKPVIGKVMSSKLTAPSSGNYKVEIVATTTKGVKLPKWTSPSIKLKK